QRPDRVQPVEQIYCEKIAASDEKIAPVVRHYRTQLSVESMGFAVLNPSYKVVETERPKAALSAAGSSIPSGIRRPRGRIAGLRGSPRRPATGRAACRRRRR